MIVENGSGIDCKFVKVCAYLLEIFITNSAKIVLGMPMVSSTKAK
jgi:hypothetical protein